MNEYNFKVGDRVRITNPSLDHFGKIGTVTKYQEIMCNPGVMVLIDGRTFELNYRFTSIEHAMDPDVITIDRSDLPEVVADGDTLECGSVIYGCTKSDYYRNNAMHYLAIAEFLEALEKVAAEDAAAQEAEAKAALFQETSEELYGFHINENTLMADKVREIIALRALVDAK